MRLKISAYAKCRFFAEIKSYFFKKLLLFPEKGCIIFPCYDESSIGDPAYRETAVGVSRSGIRESPLSERAVKAAGSYPLPYGKRGRPQGGNLGGNTESFRPMQIGEKRLFIL